MQDICWLESGFSYCLCLKILAANIQLRGNVCIGFYSKTSPAPVVTDAYTKLFFQTKEVHHSHRNKHQCLWDEVFIENRAIKGLMSLWEARDYDVLSLFLETLSINSLVPTNNFSLQKFKFLIVLICCFHWKETFSSQCRSWWKFSWDFFIWKENKQKPYKHTMQRTAWDIVPSLCLTYTPSWNSNPLTST